MPNLTSVGVTAGVPTLGTGTVSTIDALMADGGQATLGTTTGAAVSSDATGTVQQYLRGLAKSLGPITNTANALDINVKSGGNANGRAVPASSAPVVQASQTYQDVAALQTAAVLVGAGSGALGDWLDGILVIPETTAAGTVALLDNATSVNVFVTGTLTSLVPFYIPMGCLSKSGAWKITTGANVHVRAFGNFT